jgi:hypothetical protein
MCTVLLRVQCSEKFSEVLLDNAEQTALAIEGLVAPALLELFDEVYVEDVTVQRSSENND